MEIISVPAHTPYEVRLGHGLLRQCGALLREKLPPCTCAVITDDRVGALYADTVASSLREAGYRTVTFVFPHGEASKSLQTLAQIYTFLCEKEITRADCLIALGGGVAGDMTGFAAATYLRGIPFVQLPTSLLAQVDASIGGKTAIDLPEGKNLVGAFYQPLMVLCDTETLSTLPEEFLRDGMGEVIKYGMIADRELFALLSRCDLKSVPDHFEKILPACVRIKRDVVAADEWDTGRRLILNFGHTFGHAIETYYHYGTYTHGCAVAAGMCMMTRQTGTQEEYEALCACVERYGLPSQVPAPMKELLPLCGHDKKRLGGRMRYVVCSPIGTARIEETSLEAFCERFGEARGA